MAVYPGQGGGTGISHIWSGVEADSIVFQRAVTDALLEQALVCNLAAGPSSSRCGRVKCLRRRSYGEYEARKKTRVLLLRTGTRIEPADAGLG